MNYSPNSSLNLHSPPLNPIPVTLSLDTTPTDTVQHTPKTSPIKLNSRIFLFLSLPDTEFNLTPFDITTTY